MGVKRRVRIRIDELRLSGMTSKERARFVTDLVSAPVARELALRAESPRARGTIVERVLDAAAARRGRS